MDTQMNQDTTVTQTATTVEATAVAEATPAPKPIHYTIYQDSNGNEIARRVATRGRPPLGSTVNADGNRIVTNAVLDAEGNPQLATAKPAHVDVYYITVDDNGAEVSRKLKTRGRNTPGFVLHTSGPFANQWVGRPIPKVVKAPKIQKEAVEATETTETAPETAEAPLMQGAESVTGACPSLT